MEILSKEFTSRGIETATAPVNNVNDLTQAAQYLLTRDIFKNEYRVSVQGQASHVDLINPHDNLSFIYNDGGDFFLLHNFFHLLYRFRAFHHHRVSGHMF